MSIHVKEKNKCDHPVCSVTVYIISYNYGEYLQEALDSVESQTEKDWELLLIDDCSNDESLTTMRKFADRFPERVHLYHNDDRKGLRYCANLAIREARGRYIVRLDADDYFDENALLVMMHYLDMNEDVALVYPNFTYVDQNGRILAVEHRKKLGAEDKLLDLPAHGACTMVRRRILKSIGGYDETHHSQDGTELWLKIKNRYQVGNVSTPLFFYRQHPESLSQNEGRILESRRRIKRSLFKQHTYEVRPHFAVVIPVKNTYFKLPNIALRPVAGKPLIDYTIDEVLKCDFCDTILVSTDDPKVLEYCRKHPHVIAYLRPPDLSDESARWSDVLTDAVSYLERNQGIYPDILSLLSVHSPLREAAHIQEAMDSLIIADADSVVSVYENMDRQFLYGEFGLETVNQARFEHLRFEREILFTDNNAIKVIWRDSITSPDYFGQRIAHFVMPRAKSVQIRSQFDLWLVEQILTKCKDVTEKLNVCY